MPYMITPVTLSLCTTCPYIYSAKANTITLYTHRYTCMHRC